MGVEVGESTSVIVGAGEGEEVSVSGEVNAVSM